jgi:hypothetical protein
MQLNTLKDFALLGDTSLQWEHLISMINLLQPICFLDKYIS